MAKQAPPLTGLKVLELAGLAPGPFCGLLLANYGASVLRIDRPATTPTPGPATDPLTAHKTSIALDLKSDKSSHALFLSLVDTADVLIDPFRPGVLEKLDLAPATLLRRNPRLIIVRLTGFRKDGKYRDMAGHDINYLAVSGVLSLLGARGMPPSPPGNILADFAGGGLVAFTGVLLALVARAASGGRGQVVDANMVDGVSFLGTFPRLLLRTPMWSAERGTNPLDGGAPYYGCYECKDAGRYVSVGALEPKFFAELLKGLGLEEDEVTPPGKGWHRMDKRSWDYMRGVFERRFKTKTRKEWEAVFDGTDACVAPVLTNAELERDPTFELRPMVGLSETPGKEIVDKYEVKPLEAGEGGEQTLQEWMGWRKGRDYGVDERGKWFLKQKSKL